MIGLGSVGALIMAWAFILGILVGRGYKPESVIPELSKIVPPLGKGQSASVPLRLLLPEELRFFETLQEKIAPSMPASPPRQEASQAVPPPPAPKPQSTQEFTPPPLPQSVETAPAEPQFEFVYQVASFQTDAQARALQQRIVGVGGTTSVEVSVQNGRPWYRVLVSLRGSVADAEQLKNRLQTHGVTTPFLRAKKSL